MAQHYSDPAREDTLPDLETFFHNHEDAVFMVPDRCGVLKEDGEECPGTGWYWWSCFPGCLPDSEPLGPFETEAEALEDAREGIE